MATRKSPFLATTVSVLALLTVSGCATSQDGNPGYESAMTVGAQSQQKGDLSNAVTFYSRAAKVDPSRPEPLLALGDTFWQMNNPAESAKAFEAARQLDPQNVMALRGLGRAYVGLNQPKRAQEAYLAALSIDPSNAKILSGLGIAYDLEGDHATAQSHFNAGLTLAPDDADLKNNLAYSLITSRQYIQAVELLEPLVNSGNATKRQRMNLALAYGLLGRDDEARSVVRHDLSPAEIERNMGVYRQLRNEPSHARTMADIGKPIYTAPTTPRDPNAVMASTPVVAKGDPVPPPPPSSEVMLGRVEAPIEAPPPARDHIVDKAPAQVAAPVVAPVVAPVAPVATPTVAAAPTAPASSLPAPMNSGLGSGKIFLGKFTSEAAAREAWIRVWTNNSTTLSSLVASIEPNAGEVALFAVGSASAAQADSVCAQLRQNGVSCGVTN